MNQKILLHGVPDTPAMWEPLCAKLADRGISAVSPAMPGFGCAVPPGFSCTKEAYVDWFLALLDVSATEFGPADVVGHDWGALITVRAASLRPELFNSWTIANAAPHPDYRWHRTARIWQTPILGELFQALARPSQIEKALAEQGFSADLAAREARHFDRRMKRAILKLYRSAKQAGTEWHEAIDQMPKRGLIFWGDGDPFVDFWVAEAFAERTGARLDRQRGAGHWSIVERAEALAESLSDHWR